jgi:hypothetical protein
MGNRFASGKNAISECDRCGFQYKLTVLRKEIIKTKNYSILVCPTCWDPDQPQLQLGMYPVDDPQGLRDPRPDTTYYASGVTADGSIGGGSRVFQWGWAPVGGASSFDAVLTQNNLIPAVQVGTVTIVTT